MSRFGTRSKNDEIRLSLFGTRPKSNTFKFYFITFSSVTFYSHFLLQQLSSGNSLRLQCFDYFRCFHRGFLQPGFYSAFLYHFHIIFSGARRYPLSKKCHLAIREKRFSRSGFTCRLRDQRQVLFSFIDFFVLNFLSFIDLYVVNQSINHE